MLVTIIDYKAGNIASVVKAFRHLGAETLVTSDANDITTADTLVLPGVGHFSATRALDPPRAVILDRIRVGVPFLGICVGMQWLYEGSDEDPETPGLGIMLDRVRGFPNTVKSPHVGWNSVQHLGTCPLLSGVPDSAYAYFTHSYYCRLDVETIATTTYGETFASACQIADPAMRIFGVQFHVEKSSDTGLQILRNFLDISAAAHVH